MASMQKIQSGNYGANIHTRNDGGGFDVYYLYNMKDPTHFGSSGDVYDRKTYKRRTTAIKSVDSWIAVNAA